MVKLNYIDPPTVSNYKVRECREYLRKASRYSCVYCTITESESPGATFNIEHFRPKTLFPKLTNKINNLRYSCPRCNSYKGDNWIKNDEGCIYDCETCQNKVCLENIFRFVDCLHEDPVDHFVIQDNSILAPINGSKPAEHTIKFLRLNRAQLIKLRKVRSFLDMWEESLKNKREQAIIDFERINLRLSEFKKEYGETRLESSKENKMYDIIVTLFEMLQLNSSHTIDLINDELTKLDHLVETRSGADDYQNIETSR
jgi:uncharacterized protein (TIGR02646 family)